MKTIVLACVLGLLAASLAEETARTEPVDDGAGQNREVREVTDVTEVTEVEEVADSANYEEVMNRDKRNSKSCCP